ncbi:uncharacterized protein LOC127152736 isoform X1 [Labeo rohita]|uniref:uncharacterized protein LOC127152736 isoform X1 n=1 Tax=Labeo rohita TaxID=84645 RepID=UPI0021E28261|nr:uncharacterized protein LOC127152736 isoform X1 [Labeo rohita]
MNLQQNLVQMCMVTTARMLKQWNLVFLVTSALMNLQQNLVQMCMVTTARMLKQWNPALPGNFSLDESAAESGSDVHGNFSQDAEAEKPSSGPFHELNTHLVILPGSQESESDEESADTSHESKPSLIIVYGNFSDNDNLEIFVNGSDSSDVGLP